MLSDEDAKSYSQQAEQRMKASVNAFEECWVLEFKHNFPMVDGTTQGMMIQYISSLINTIRADLRGCVDSVLRAANTQRRKEDILEIQALLNSLSFLVCQHCSSRIDPGRGLDSLNIEANAKAMRILRDFGIIEITTDEGNRVIGKLREVKG